MQSILIDAGPMIALFDKSDRFHEKAINFIRSNNSRLISTWPVITEVSHMLDFSTRTQINFLTWINRGGVQIFDLEFYHISRMIELSDKFIDVPMDLADASLVVASESTGISDIASIDSDFYIYRDIRNKYLTNVFL